MSYTCVKIIMRDKATRYSLFLVSIVVSPSFHGLKKGEDVTMIWLRWYDVSQKDWTRRNISPVVPPIIHAHISLVLEVDVTLAVWACKPSQEYQIHNDYHYLLWILLHGTHQNKNTHYVYCTHTQLIFCYSFLGIFGDTDTTQGVMGTKMKK